MNHEFAQIIGGSRWLMEPKAFRAMVKRAEAATPALIEAAMQAYSTDRSPGLNMTGDVAVINACGPITYKRSWFSCYFGAATIEDMQAQFRLALADASVKTIVFRADSPGGSVEFVPEFADEIYAARGQKPIIAVADTMICSAAQWIFAQTDLTYASASSWLGACGVFMEHFDISEMLAKAGVKVSIIRHGEKKAIDTEYEPLSDEARADLQAYVDEIGGEFDAAMARGRGVTKKVVLDTFGQGKAFRGKEAIAIGLADKPGTFAQVMAKLTKGRVSVGARANAGAAPAIQATVDLSEPDAPVVEAPEPDIASVSEATETKPTVDPALAARQAQADADLLSITLALLR